MAVVSFVFVLPMNKSRELARITPKADETPYDVLLLTEIRDLLAQGNGGSPASAERDRDGS
jgi:large-conductance mechanosensitive channel